MNIAIMSPHCHGNGTTTVAALIAATMAKQNTKVCLTHVTAKSEALYPYFNLSNGGTNATDAMQLTKLIRTGGMQKNSLSNYCKDISENFDVFSLDSTAGIPEEEIADVVTYIAQNAPYDYVVFDVDDNNMDKPNVRAVIDNADCVILVLSQMITERNRFKEIKAAFISATNKVPTIVVLNKYRSSLGNLKETAATMGVKNIKHWHYLHDNPYVELCENKGQLQFLIEQINKKTGDVLELDTDIQKIVKDIITTKRAISQHRSGNDVKEMFNE